jgi:hypothetical protein
MLAWWGTRQNVSIRLRMEVKLMNEIFGEIFTLYVPIFGELYWQGTVELNLQGVSQRQHTLKIVYPEDYSNRPPEAYVLSLQIQSEIYQHKNGKLSLFNPKDGPSSGWNPSSSTAITIAGWSIQWLYCYYTWKLTGTWPEVGQVSEE